MIYLFLMIIVLTLTIAWIIINLKSNKNNFLLKGFLITFMLYITLCIFYSFENIKGFPSTNYLPNKFRLESFIIEEPNKVLKTEGYIHLWVILEDANKCPPGLICVKPKTLKTPKAYSIPYTQKMHEKLLEAKEKLKEGEILIIEIRKNGRPLFGGQKNNNDDFIFYNNPINNREIVKE